MTDRFKTAIMLLAYDQLSDIDLEDYLDWDEDEAESVIRKLFVELNYDNRCPFKLYGCVDSCKHKTSNNCVDDLNIDCGIKGVDAWESWIVSNWLENRR